MRPWCPPPPLLPPSLPPSCAPSLRGARERPSSLHVLLQVTWADLQSMEHSGHIDGNSYVFTEGMPDWQLASEINWRGSEPSA